MARRAHAADRRRRSRWRGCAGHACRRAPRAARARARPRRRSCGRRARPACSRSCGRRPRAASPGSGRRKAASSAGATGARPPPPPPPRAAPAACCARCRPAAAARARRVTRATQACAIASGAGREPAGVGVDRAEPRGLELLDLAPQAREQAARGLAVARHVVRTARARGHSSSASSIGISSAHAGRQRVRRRRLHQPALARIAAHDHRTARQLGRGGALDAGVEAGHLGVEDDARHLALGRRLEHEPRGAELLDQQRARREQARAPLAPALEPVARSADGGGARTARARARPAPGPSPRCRSRSGRSRRRARRSRRPPCTPRC